ncbi:hypothetical protein ACS0TY_003989 [Phlomoides rotata]
MEGASEALNVIQAESALYRDSDDRLLAEINCTVYLNTVLHKHQINSTQRNRLQWLKDGDRNSQFFYTMNRIRKTSIGLSSLVVDGEITFDPGIISDSVVQFYTDLFMAQDQVTYDDSILGNFIHPVVDPTENDSLNALPSVEEIRRAVFYMEPSSSPGPDGFDGAFYQTCWDIIAFDVIEAVRYFFTTGFISFGLNSSFVTLIPNKSGANRVEDFRPIVMGNYLFKIFTKILASRLGIIATRAPRTYHLTALADSIISKFSKWKGHSLSLAGRKCMINFVIAASLRNNSCSVSWARVCSPLDEGGLGVRSIRLANDSFICKLAWDILCNRSSDMTLLHHRYFTAGGRPRAPGRPSSLGPVLISFWNDNWLGYIILDRIGIPPSYAAGLSSKIRDYFYEEIWHFDFEFFMKHTDIVRDILRWLTTSFVLPILGLTGLPGSGVALYHHVAPPSSGGLFGGNSQLLIGSAILVFRAPRFAFFVTLILSLWITYLLTTRLLIVFYAELLLCLT